MIFIALVIVGIIISLLKLNMAVFLVAAIVIVGVAFVLKDKLNCPFTKICPFSICPLNKKK